MQHFSVFGLLDGDDLIAVALKFVHSFERGVGVMPGNSFGGPEGGFVNIAVRRGAGYAAKPDGLN